ncbi:Hypothetical protein Bdt_1276 [Bdellovibrio bacteriovorus str. Tiberius]|uniref:Uncharacterized protein n=1 Tax=Bdellovibrio bacteriovorus str. Tiberius TaxID=1069642 RepID=K7YWA3_BDEBC|nr:Hypothetical protein Bdt_1276 [Bdellovibrio bacteriovorus str. Tiberius]
MCAIFRDEYDKIGCQNHARQGFLEKTSWAGGPLGEELSPFASDSPRLRLRNLRKG